MAPDAAVCDRDQTRAQSRTPTQVQAEVEVAVVVGVVVVVGEGEGEGVGVGRVGIGDEVEDADPVHQAGLAADVTQACASPAMRCCAASWPCSVPTPPRIDTVHMFFMVFSCPKTMGKEVPFPLRGATQPPTSKYLG